ncbi:hypothetical protein VKT23_007866 [Stygiomarasmius scandens]|uniref:SCP domain-containing protein n=1 Tax=Marasmiellus scandens TaxID=2682957 RepID=A0ABR1JKT8_9AGAR
MKFTFQFAILALFSASAFALPSQLESRQDIKSQALSLHNDARAKYGAAPLTWNDQIAGQVRDYANNGDKGVGENLGAGTGDYSIADAVNGWMAESSKYDYNHPGFSAATGHFTQASCMITENISGC